ncbi:hypothetical protein JQX13_51385 [Archangium violaceum]|uniref:hypothetical protein n=1 Tax=Archangium violaceum TaxID=83451 RepID=UPI00193C1405|nr:hypothetical protein [Archangium violaceum]QRK08246.1 hypothetical protein JQX13_51385 [Archangium violaceum]
MRPQDILPDDVNEVRLGGILARKGSVAAFMANARVLSDPAASEEARTEAERHIVELLPALRALGVFDVFEIRNETVRAFVAKHERGAPAR